MEVEMTVHNIDLLNGVPWNYLSIPCANLQKNAGN
jgi:hypothetical protein